VYYLLESRLSFIRIYVSVFCFVVIGYKSCNLYNLMGLEYSDKFTYLLPYTFKLQVLCVSCF